MVFFGPCYAVSCYFVHKPTHGNSVQYNNCNQSAFHFGQMLLSVHPFSHSTQPFSLSSLSRLDFQTDLLLQGDRRHKSAYIVSLYHTLTICNPLSILSRLERTTPQLLLGSHHYFFRSQLCGCWFWLNNQLLP